MRLQSIELWCFVYVFSAFLRGFGIVSGFYRLGKNASVLRWVLKQTSFESVLATVTNIAVHPKKVIDNEIPTVCRENIFGPETALVVSLFAELF